MTNHDVYRGTVRTGRGGAVAEMSKPGGVEGLAMLTGLRVIPGTMNVLLAEPFELSRLRYFRFADADWDFHPASQGIEFTGETGVHYGRITIAGACPGVLLFWTWVPDIRRYAELASPVHLRTELGLKDGDTVFFTLDGPGPA